MENKIFNAGIKSAEVLQLAKDKNRGRKETNYYVTTETCTDWYSYGMYTYGGETYTTTPTYNGTTCKTETVWYPDPVYPTTYPTETNPPPTGGGGGGDGQDDQSPEGTGETNGERDPDLPSNCASWAFVPASNGDYQVCGVSNLRFDYITEYLDSQGRINIDYFRGSFSKTIYFEFPRKRGDGTFYSSAEAALINAKLKDKAEETLESQVQSSPPPSNSLETEAMLQRFFNILKSEAAFWGGRVTMRNNYGTTSIRNYSKTVGGCL